MHSGGGGRSLFCLGLMARLHLVAKRLSHPMGQESTLIVQEELDVLLQKCQFIAQLVLRSLLLFLGRLELQELFLELRFDSVLNSVLDEEAEGFLQNLELFLEELEEEVVLFVDG